MTPYTLHYAPDNASLIIRLALTELGQPFRTHLVDRSVKAQRAAAYTALNPAGRIPTLETPDGPISETAAILLWLSDRHGQLLPQAGAADRGAALNWLFYLSNTLHPDMLMLFYTKRYGPAAQIPALRATACERLTRTLDTLHDDARARLPGWLCGDAPSALDLYLAAALRWMRLYPADHADWLDMTRYPAFQDMCQRLDARPSVAALCAAEGMGPMPFTTPRPPTPSEGTAI